MRPGSSPEPNGVVGEASVSSTHMSYKDDNSSIKDPVILRILNTEVPTGMRMKTTMSVYDYLSLPFPEIKYICTYCEVIHNTESREVIIYKYNLKQP